MTHIQDLSNQNPWRLSRAAHKGRLLCFRAVTHETRGRNRSCPMEKSKRRAIRKRLGWRWSKLRQPADTINSNQLLAVKASRCTSASCYANKNRLSFSLACGTFKDIVWRKTVLGVLTSWILYAVLFAPPPHPPPSHPPPPPHKHTHTNRGFIGNVGASVLIPLSGLVLRQKTAGRGL